VALTGCKYSSDGSEEPSISADIWEVRKFVKTKGEQMTG
jgi:hypothetical protein